MPFSFLPKLIVHGLPDLSLELLHRRGIRLLMLDFDNTIVPYTTNIPSESMEAWLQSIRQSDIQVCIVSNSTKNRVVNFAQSYDLPVITHSRKPFPKGIRQCLNRYQIPADCCALAGDQIFTDTLGANCQGVQSILVKAIHNHTLLLKARHIFELPFIFMARNRRMKT